MLGWKAHERNRVDIRKGGEVSYRDEEELCAGVLEDVFTPVIAPEDIGCLHCDSHGLSDSIACVEEETRSSRDIK